jgi:DNA topoisomerase-3
LLGKLEKYNIGTEATRASIIETLLKRDYIRRDKKNLVATDLGRNLIKAIDTEMLKSVELTAELEDKLEKIADGKIEYNEVLEDSIKNLKTEIEKLKISTGEVI